MVNVGILGLGPAWERRYRPALENLGQRVRLAAVYDPVLNLAEQAATDLRASAVPGILALLEHPQIQAILVLDTAWYGPDVLELLCRSEKPVYLAGNLGDDVDRLRRCHERAVARGLTLVPEFSRRYTPATNRLQELMATELGPPHHLVIATHGSDRDDGDARPGACLTGDFLVGLFDWCRYVLRTLPVSLQAHAPDSGRKAVTPRCSMNVKFRTPRTGGPAPWAELHLFDRRTDCERSPETRRASRATDPSFPEVSYEIRCVHGFARIGSPVEISWGTGSKLRTESLKTERCEIEVMLDHFCRRAAGGLIPVADLADRCRSLILTQAAEESLRTGRKIMLNGDR